MRARIRALVVIVTMAVAGACDDDEEVALDAAADRPADATHGDAGTDTVGTDASDGGADLINADGSDDADGP